MVSDDEYKDVLHSVLSLNPCSNGIWSLTGDGDGDCAEVPSGLNPCSNGIWSLTSNLSSTYQ